MRISCSIVTRLYCKYNIEIKTLFYILRSLTEYDCDTFIDSAGLSFLAYLEKQEVDRIAKGETTQWSKEVWPSFKQYTGDYKLFHDDSTDADVILLANSQQGRVLNSFYQL